MKDAVAGTYTVHINPAGIKSYTVCKQPNKPKPQNASALAYTHTHTHTEIALLFSPWQSAQEIKCNSYPIFFL